MSFKEICISHVYKPVVAEETQHPILNSTSHSQLNIPFSTYDTSKEACIHPKKLANEAHIRDVYKPVAAEEVHCPVINIPHVKTDLYSVPETLNPKP